MHCSKNFRPPFTIKSHFVRFITDSEYDDLIENGIIETTESGNLIFYTPYNVKVEFCKDKYYIICSVENSLDACPIQKDIFNREFTKCPESNTYQRRN